MAKQPVPPKQRKGKAYRRGTPIYYDEKKKRFTIWLTPALIGRLDDQAADIGVSRSEFVERSLRQSITETAQSENPD